MKKGFRFLILLVILFASFGMVINTNAAGRKNYSNLVWSPNMQKVAFLETDGVYTNLMVADATGSNIKRLTSGFIDEYPAWSPDSKRLVFRREIKGDSSYIFSRLIIYVIDADGNDLRELVPGSGDKKALQHTPVWSPDGRKIAFADNKSLVVVNADGTDPKVLMSDSVYESLCPAWSPDNKWLAVTKSSSPTSITLINADKGFEDPKIQKIIEYVHINKCATWSPDNKRLAFVEPGSLTVINADGSNRKDYSFSSSVVTRLSVPKWSPDGSRIAFVRDSDSWGNHVFFISTENLTQNNWTPEVAVKKDKAIYDYSWSPDGKFITYDLDEIYVVSADGSNPHPFPFQN